MYFYLSVTSLPTQHIHVQTTIGPHFRGRVIREVAIEHLRTPTIKPDRPGRKSQNDPIAAC